MSLIESFDLSEWVIEAAKIVFSLERLYGQFTFQESHIQKHWVASKVDPAFSTKTFCWLSGKK